MMSINKLVLLCFLIQGLIMVGMSFNLNINKANYQKGDDFWTIDIPVQNFTGNSYICIYENLPSEWRTQGNKLLVPTSVTKSSNNQLLKMVVRSNVGDQLRRSLLLNFSGSGIFISQNSYESNLQTILRNSISSSISSSLSSNSFGNVNIGSSMGSIGSYLRSFEPLSTDFLNTRIMRSEYSNLPSYSDLNKIVDTADVVLITKTIQSVIQSNLNCLAKIGYLSDFLGKIQSYIAIKGFRAQDLQNIIKAAQDQIAKLQAKNKDFQTEITSLGTVDLKIELNKMIVKLQSAYQDYNNAGDTSSLQMKISTLKNQINSLNNEINKANAQLRSDKFNVPSLDALIKDLQNKLTKAKTDRDNYNKRITQTQSFISKSSDRLKQANQQIDDINLKLKDIANNKQNLKAIYKSLERDIDDLKSKINQNQRREADLISRISDNKLQISRQQIRLDPSELNKINETILTLKNALPTIKSKIDTLDLKCNGVTDINNGNGNGNGTGAGAGAGVGTGAGNGNGNGNFYVFNPTQFKTFFNGLYGVDAYNSFSSSFNFNMNSNTRLPLTNLQGNDDLTKLLNLYSYSIFSDQWQSKYGRSYEKEIKSAYNRGPITDYTFSNDFQCSSTYNNLNNSVGKIVKIENNVITVQNNSGQMLELQLGACSRITGVNTNIPSVGSNIAWKGALNSGNRYFTHTATCY